jgi:hypothetical protein
MLSMTFSAPAPTMLAESATTSTATKTTSTPISLGKGLLVAFGIPCLFLLAMGIAAGERG